MFGVVKQKDFEIFFIKKKKEKDFFNKFWLSSLSNHILFFLAIITKNVFLTSEDRVTNSYIDLFCIN